jgi:hypothetical protein
VPQFDAIKYEPYGEEKAYLTPETSGIYTEPYRKFAGCICKVFDRGERFSDRSAIEMCGGNHDSVRDWINDMEGREICADGRKLQSICETYKYYFD